MAGAEQPGRLLLEQPIQRMRLLAVDLDLGEQREGYAVCQRAEAAISASSPGS